MESIYPQSWSITCLHLSKSKHEQVRGKICKTEGVAAVKRRHRSPCLASTPTSSSSSSLPQAALPVSPCPPPTGCPARPASSRSHTRVAATANAPPQEVSPRLGVQLPSLSTDRTRPPGSGDTATPPARDPPRDRQQRQLQLRQSSQWTMSCRSSSYTARFLECSKNQKYQGCHVIIIIVILLSCKICM